MQFFLNNLLCIVNICDLHCGRSFIIGSIVSSADKVYPTSSHRREPICAALGSVPRGYGRLLNVTARKYREIERIANYLIR